MNKYSNFFDEMFTSPMIIHPSGLLKYIPYIKAVSDGQILTLPERPVLKMGLFDELLNRINPEDNKTENGVAVIPITGVMTRSGSWWDYGTEDIAQMIDDAWENPSIAAVILKANTPGGTTDSMFPIKQVLPKKNKPLICAVYGNALSSGYFTASYCDKIIAVDPMAQVGSIGVQGEVRNYDEYYKLLGIKVIAIIPPESNWKNKAYNEAKAGNPDLLIQEELRPWALHFQSIVRANRPNLNESIEGTIQGRTFFANFGDINGKTTGLIDDVMPFDDIITLAFTLAKSQQAKQLFNS